MFEPFYQADTSRAQRGFGLGLAIVKKVVELHGWRLMRPAVPKRVRNSRWHSRRSMDVVVPLNPLLGRGLYYDRSGRRQR